MTTKIEWCARPGTIPETWNPVTGCTPISEGCKNCYAQRMARRLAGRHGYPEAPNHFDVTLRPERLDIPLKWRKPRTVFVCSMSDLFHEDVPFDFVDETMTVISACNGIHTFLALTKRPGRMLNYFSSRQYFASEQYENKPLQNLWLGVTIEMPEYLRRVDCLRQTPAAVRFLSLEPLLGPVDLADYLPRVIHDSYPGSTGPEFQDGLDWIIVGGETGPGARPIRPDWAREIRDQCRDAGVPFFFKKMSGRKPIPDDLMIREFPGA